MDAHTIEQLEEKLNYRFQEKALLLQALSHSSYANEHREKVRGDNERLEFLGDAVLELVSSRFLYVNYPKLPEGDLTRLRASIVCEPTLALCARQFGLPEYLLLGRGEEHTGGRKRDSIVSDALEALIGALFLDGGLEPAQAFIERFVLTDIEHKKLFYDSKTILQEVLQRDFRGSSAQYTLTGESGPDHDKHFEVAFSIDGEVLGRGGGSTKKAAEQEAAYHTLVALKQRGIAVS